MHFNLEHVIRRVIPPIVRAKLMDHVDDAFLSPDDYDDVVAADAAPVAMLRQFVSAPGSTGWHRHRRSQLLYATSGLMVICTERAAWMAPAGHALLIAPGVLHDAACQGPLGLCTAYIDPSLTRRCVPEGGCRLVEVSALLDAALRSLAEEGGQFDPDGRSGLLTRVVVSEIERVEDAGPALPMPQDARLRRVCQTLIEQPAVEHGIDDWAHEAGLSRRTFTRRFRTETSMSFAEWRRRLRATKATIVRADGRSLSAAAGAVGYRSVDGLRAMMRRAAPRPSGD